MIRGLVIALIALVAVLCFAGVYPADSAETQAFALGALWMGAIWLTARLGR